MLGCQLVPAQWRPHGPCPQTVNATQPCFHRVRYCSPRYHVSVCRFSNKARAATKPGLLCPLPGNRILAGCASVSVSLDESILCAPCASILRIKNGTGLYLCHPHRPATVLLHITSIRLFFSIRVFETTSTCSFAQRNNSVFREECSCGAERPHNGGQSESVAYTHTRILTVKSESQGVPLRHAGAKGDNSKRSYSFLTSG
jgi:hypothetical protein